MTILHVATFLQGGAGRAIAALAAGQRRAGHEVIVVASRTGAPGYGNYPGHLDDLEDARVPVRLVDSLFARDYAANLRAIEAMRRIADAVGAPAVLHAHAAIPAFAGVALAGLLRRRMALVQTMHGWGTAKTPSQTETDVRVMNLMDRVIVPAQVTADRLIALGVEASRLSVVPYGVDRLVQVRLGARDEALVHEIREWRRRSKFVVCCVGTIGERKNQAVLVDALAHLVEPDAIRLVFLGDGDAAGLTARVESAGAIERVRVHGYTPAARQMAAETDLVALPSRSEEQPLTVLESFCDRALVLTSDIPELAAIVADGVTGLRCAAGEARAVAGAIDRARALSPETRDAILERASDLYSRTFTEREMLAAYAREYREAVAGPVLKERSPDRAFAVGQR